MMVVQCNWNPFFTRKLRRKSTPTAGASFNEYPTFTAMAEDDQNRLWLASNMGLFYLHGDSLIRWRFPNPYTSFPHLIDIAYDEGGRLWLSTLGEGVWQGQIDEQHELKIIKQWNQKDGLISNTFLDLHLDQRKRLWMADIKGICCLDEDQLLCFTKADGWMDISSQRLKMLENTG